MPIPAHMATLPPETRTGEPSFDREASEIYSRALDALEPHASRYLVGGALALNAYTGIWRYTKDLDLFCRPGEAEPILAALRDAGFETELVYESWLGKAWEGDTFVDVIWRNANALFPVTDDWFRGGAALRLFGRDLQAIPVEHLILSKMMVGGRFRFDGADLMHVIYRAHDRIDWERLQRIAGEHVGLLLAYLHMYRWGYPGFKDHVPDVVMARYERLAQERESTYGPFRAKLLDIQTFAVDTQEWGLPDPHKQALTDIFGTWKGKQ